VGTLNAAVAAYYYLRVVVTLYMRESETDELPLPLTPATAAVLVISAAGVLYLGLAPGRLFDLVRDLASSII
jgi:NADH-quinone oxidoreductase subunit N